jgi:hypothetical protein
MRKLIIGLFALAMAFVSAVLGQTENPASCPSVSVIGPAGITQPGDPMIFATNPPLNDREGLSFHWTISAGTIIKGEKSQVIEVQTTREMNNSSITATVEILGLPKGCVRTASESAAVSSGFHPVKSDEFGKLSRNDTRGQLDVFFNEVLNNKDDVGFIVLRAAPGKSHHRLKQRFELIRRHIAFRKFPRESIVVCSEPGEREPSEYTVFWRSPRKNLSYFCPSGVIL